MVWVRWSPITWEPCFTVSWSDSDFNISSKRASSPRVSVRIGHFFRFLHFDFRPLPVTWATKMSDKLRRKLFTSRSWRLRILHSFIYIRFIPCVTYFFQRRCGGGRVVWYWYGRGFLRNTCVVCDGRWQKITIAKCIAIEGNSSVGTWNPFLKMTRFCHSWTITSNWFSRVAR